MGEPAIKKRRLSPPGDDDASASRPGFLQWDLEQDYENRSRKKKKEASKQDRLMIKTQDGQVKENPRLDVVEEKEKPQDQDDEDVDSFLASDDDEVVVEAVKKPSIPVKEQIRLAKEELARLAAQLSENPEENVGQLGALADMANSHNVTIKKLALATQLAVYKDIIPGYRIRPLTDADMAAKTSKEVKKLRAFEQGLLNGYKHYVTALGRLAVYNPKSKLDAQSATAIASVAISCACALMTSVSHFNCRPELIAILVKKLASRNVDADFIKCREAFAQLFEEDEGGHASLDVVGQLTRMMKSKNFYVHESVVNTFLHLRLLSEFAHKASTNSIDKDAPDALVLKKPKQKREFRTKRERKVLRDRKEVENEMKEADAAVSYEERDKNQSETLKLVFVAYFRILKERTQHLMGAVLEGLAKYSHLINQDFFGDILEALKDLIDEANAALLQPTPDEATTDHELAADDKAQRNATRESLLCIITAFALLQGQTDVIKSANSLNLDLTFFITHLYRTLIPLSMDPDIELSAKKTQHLADPNHLPVPGQSENKVNVATTTVLLLRSLSAVLLPPTGTKSVPPVRVAGFTKQLASLALHSPAKTTIAIVELLKQVTKTHGGKVASLWNTEERKGDGVFMPLAEGVEGSNPFAATVWEGELLRHHFDPKVREGVKIVEGNVRTARG